MTDATPNPATGAPLPPPSGAPRVGDAPPEAVPAPGSAAATAIPSPAAAPGVPGAPVSPPRKLGTGALLGIIGGAVALVVIVAVVVIAAILPNLTSGTSPSAVAEAYLTAIAEGDAETALTYLDDAPGETTLLTDEVLEVSRSLAPIEDIEVVEATSDQFSGEVTVSYTLGGEPVTTTYNVYNSDDEWEISGGLSTLITSQLKGLGVTVNGAAIDGDSYEVFPGTYEFATTLPAFTLGDDAIFSATDPYESPDTYNIEPALSEEGLTQFRQLVRAAVDACLASPNLAAGCGIDIPAVLSDGTQMKDGTLRRSLTADTQVKLESLEATLSYDVPTLARGDYIGGVQVEGDCTKNGASGTCSVLFGPSLGTPSVDMAAETPTVLWD